MFRPSHISKVRFEYCLVLAVLVVIPVAANLHHESGIIYFKLPQKSSSPIYHYSQSPTGICSTAWRKTGSTFVYTLLVRSGDECSNNFCVTAVEIPF